MHLVSSPCISDCFNSLAAHHTLCRALRLHTGYRIDGWTAAEQQAWLAAPTGPAQFHDCIGIVDATYVRVERPANSKLERRLYSTYKKYHAVFFMVIVDRRGQRPCVARRSSSHALTCSPCHMSVRPGFIRYVDNGNSPKGGSESTALYRARDIFLHPDLFLLGDVAYHSDDRCRTGYRAPDLTLAKAGTAAEQARRLLFNQQLSAERQRVEHTFSRLKHTWRLLQATWNMDLARLAPTFRACCLLCNWLHHTRNLYS